MNRRIFFAIALAVGLVAPAVAQSPSRFVVTVTGAGPDVILIPGLGSSAATWDTTVKQLSPTHRVHVLQVAGFAGLDPGPNAGDGPMLPGLVAEVSAYAAKLNQPAVIGHSLGGLVALEAASQEGSNISRVLVVDALPFYGLLGGPQMTVGAFKPQATMMRDQILGLSDQTFAAMQARGAGQFAKSPDKQKLITDWTLASDRKVFAKAMYEDSTEDARLVLPKIKAKTTVLYAYDSSSPYPQANFDGMYKLAYASLPSVTLKRVDGSMHFIMFDQPEAFADHVTEFLK